MSVEEHGEGIFFDEPLTEKELVIKGLFEDVAGVSATVLVAFSPAVSTVVVCKAYISTAVEIGGKHIIHACIFTHAVTELDDSFW